MRPHRLSRGLPRPPLPCVLNAALLGAGLLLAQPTLAQASREPSERSAQARHYEIPAAPLAEVLNRYAAESRVVLVLDAGLLRGSSSSGLNGRYELMAGFRALLEGTGLEVQPSAAGGYLVKRQTSPHNKILTEAGEILPQQALPVVRASSSKLLSTVEQLDRAMIRNMPALNGDLTSQLRLNPNVQYSERALSSNTAGEIAPAEISIHGAKPYQNQITIDGVSVMNDLDPGETTFDNAGLVPGASQALAIDSSLLCEVTVQDANVSAEHGRFTGGLVEAKVCNARKKLGGSVGVGYTSSEWTHVFIDPARRAEFEDSSSAELQPRFIKRTYRASVEARPTPQWGLLLSAVRRESDIPLKRFTTANTTTTESREVTQHRQQDTLLIKTDYAPQGSEHRGDLTLVYAPSSNRYFKADYRNSDYTLEGGGLSLAGRLESRYELATLTQQLALSRTEQSRRSDADYYRNWRWSTDKNWGDPAVSVPTSGEGGWGDVDQQLRTLTYGVKAAFKPLVLGATRHRLLAGLELRRQSADYERLSLTRQYLTQTDLPTALASCRLPDGSTDTEACSSTPSLNRRVGQYFIRLQSFRPGRFDLNAHGEAVFLQDEISWGAWSLRAGLRADRDSVTDDTNLAPRLRLGWQPHEYVSVDLGANRYYGRSLFAYALKEKINTLMSVQTRRATLVWGAATQSLPLNRLESMKTPYDDELSAGLSFEPAWLAGPLSLRFTHRAGHDQVVKRVVSRQSDCNGGTCYIYTNDGRSRTQDWTLSWSNSAAFKTGAAVHRLWLAFNKSNVTTNYASYADNFGNDQLDDVVVQYNGQFMRYSELPADNYNRPWTLRVGVISSLPAYHLTFSNILRIRDRYQQMLSAGTTEHQGMTVDVYKRTPLPRSLTLDTVIHWEPRLARDQRLDLKLTIENLSNRKNKIAVNNTYATYERGRSVVLELGYEF